MIMATILVVTMNAGASELVAPERFWSVDSCLAQIERIEAEVLPEFVPEILIGHLTRCMADQRQ